MDYKLCILAAGKGTRNRYALNSNKALLPLGEGTALSYIIGKFPPEIDIVIAVGYNAEQVAVYALTNWRKRVVCVRVDFEGEKRGPGYSLWQCRALLQRPFIFMACDTIVTDKIPEPTRNWMGITLVDRNESYLTIDLNKDRVRKIYDKGDKNATHLASIGLVGVKDVEDFWEGLAHPNKVQGEIQDSPGLRALIKKDLYTEHFHWFDIGTTEGYENTKRRFDKSISE